jgi:hypothetical protein
MNDAPEKGRGTTGFGRPTDRTRNRTLGEASVHGLSHAVPKCVSVFPISHVTPCKRPVSREYGFVLVQRSSSSHDLDLTDQPTRKPGARESARYVEVGGSGGIPGGWLRRPRPSGRNSSAVLWRWLSVTCLLRHFPPPARSLAGGREAKTPKSGAKTEQSVESLRRQNLIFAILVFSSSEMGAENQCMKSDMNIGRYPPTVLYQEGEI